MEGKDVGLKVGGKSEFKEDLGEKGDSRAGEKREGESERKREREYERQKEEGGRQCGEEKNTT